MLCIQRWLNLALDLLIAALAVLVISLAIGLKGTTTGGQIGIALNVVLGFNSVLLRLVETWTDLETSLGAIARLKNFEIDTISEDQLRESSEPDEKWPQYGGVEFRNVSASYGYDRSLPSFFLCSALIW
jgi:ATP-binding cassette subfamily C (CFTR/MRP) protein 1